MTAAGRRFRLYSDRSLLRPGKPHVVALYPLWGKPSDMEGESPWPEFADEFVRKGPELFELSDLETADIAVFPWNWKSASKYPEGPELAERFLEQARAAQKPAVFFLGGDSTDPFPYDGATVFRTSILRTRRRSGEFAEPGFHGDLLDRFGGEVPLRTKSGRPTVGFCGMVLQEKERRGRLRRLAGRRKDSLARLVGSAPASDVFVRARALEALRRQSEVETDFVVRDRGGGGALYPRPDRERWGQVQDEYVRNMVGSDYVLCARGLGNWSWRLYETLCMGRIPVFVDTDCVLPYDFLIDWREYVVWVDRSEISSIGEKVAAFHEALTDADFRERQHACRRLWEDYLSTLGFFTNFPRHFPGAEADGLSPAGAAAVRSG